MLLKRHYPFPAPKASLLCYPGAERGWGENLQMLLCQRGASSGEAAGRGEGGVRAAPPLPPSVSSAFQTVPWLAKLSCQREGVIKPAWQVLRVASIPSFHALLSGSYVTSHRVMATRRLLGYL